jgi:hypothetical protein
VIYVTNYEIITFEAGYLVNIITENLVYNMTCLFGKRVYKENYFSAPRKLRGNCDKITPIKHKGHTSLDYMNVHCLLLINVCSEHSLLQAEVFCRRIRRRWRDNIKII